MSTTPTVPAGYTLESAFPAPTVVPPAGYTPENKQVVVGAMNNPALVGGPDPRLTVETQLALEKSPWAIREHVPIQDVKVYRADPSQSSNFVDAANPVAGVPEGATQRIDVYNPAIYTGKNEGEYATHEATHLMQNEETAAQQTAIPQLGSYKSQYSDYNLTPAELLALRAKGDTFQDHTREGQASILQKYQDKEDWLRDKATPQQRADFMASTGEFKGAGNAEWMAAYQPYLDDAESMKMAGDKALPATQIQLPAGYTLEQ